MSTNIGRKGFIGVVKETTPAGPLPATDWVPFTGETLHGMSDSIADQTARGIRDENYGSVQGKLWSEGDVEFHLDPNMAGYFLSAAYGSSTQGSVGNGVSNHVLGVTNSNQPYTLTVTLDRVTDRQFYRGVVVDKLNIKAADSWIETKASLKGFFPRTTASGSPTTASGTQFSWAQYNVFFGSTGAAVGTTISGASTKMTDFSLDITNNAAPTFRSGNYEPATIDQQQFSASGDYTLFFENTTDRDTYYNTTKESMVFQALGAGIGGGNTETITLNFPQIRLDAFTLETGLNNFFAEKVKWVAEYNSTAGFTTNGVVVNRNSNF